jgi:hypothetical protein
MAARLKAERTAHFLRNSGRYPLCGRGDVDTYALFAEHGTTAIAKAGRFGIIAPVSSGTVASASTDRATPQGYALARLSRPAVKGGGGTEAGVALREISRPGT